MALVSFLVVVAQAELRTQWALESSVAAVRRSVERGDFYSANNFRNVQRRGLTFRYKHPRGGPTTEHLTVCRADAKGYVLQVRAQSPRCVCGENFHTSVTFDADEGSSTSDLTCRVVWHKEPVRFLKRRIERAAERGAADAWRTWACWLDDENKSAEAKKRQRGAVAVATKAGILVGSFLLGLWLYRWLMEKIAEWIIWELFGV